MKTRTAGTITALIVGIFTATAAHGTTYYLKTGATDFSVAASYAMDEAGTQTATSLPGASDQIMLPDNTTFAIAGGSADFAVLSGVMRVRPRPNSVVEFTIADGVTSTFNAAFNWDADTKLWSKENEIHCNGKIVKKGGGTLILAASGTMKYGITANQDYFTAIDLQQGTHKFPQHAVGNMYFGDLTLAEGTTLVTAGEIDDVNKAIATYFRSISGYGMVTNETGRTAGQTCSPYSRNIIYANEFHGKYCYPAKHWLDGRFVQYGHETFMSNIVCVQNNLGHLNDGYDYGVYSFEDVALLGPHPSIEFYGNGGGFHYFGGVDATMAKSGMLYTRQFPAFFDGGWHGGLRCTGGWTVNADKEEHAVQKWLVLMGSNTVPCTIEGGFGENAFSDSSYASPDGIPYTIVVQKLGSGTWRFKNNRNHGGGFAIEEGTLQFDSIAEKGIASSLGRSTNLTDLCSVRDLSGHRVNYAFALGSTNAGAPEAVFEYTGASSGRSTTRPLVLVGAGGHLRASAGSLSFHGISARDANTTPTLTLDGSATGCKAYNVTTGAANAAVNVVKSGTGEWTLGGNLDIGGKVRVENGTLSLNTEISRQYADYKWFRISFAQIGPATNTQFLIRKVSLFNAAGVRQNGGLRLPASVTPHVTGIAAETRTVEAAEIGKGEIWIDPSYAGKSITYDINSSDLDALCNNVFANADGADGSLTLSFPSTDKPTPNKPSTWFPIVMHLDDSADPIAKFDIQLYSNSLAVAPLRVIIEGSHDGGAWEQVYSNVAADSPLLAQSLEWYNRWLSDCYTSPSAAQNDAIPSAYVLSASGSRQEAYYSWYRLRFAKLGNGGNNLQIRQIGLFDKAGRRVNKGLKLVEGPSATANERREIVGTMPGPGQVGYGYTAVGRKVQGTSATYLGEIEACFANVYSGSTATSGRCEIYWQKSDNSACNPTPSDSSTWIPIVMHLAAPTAVHHFDIQLFSNANLNNSPVRLMLEGSTDGDTWHILFNNATEGEAFSTNPTAYNCWLTDLVSASEDNRPEGKGITIGSAYEPDNGFVQFPNGLKAQVVSNGVLVARGPVTVNELSIDATSAGTMRGMIFAEQGVLRLVNLPDGGAVLPGTYEDCEGLERVAGWTVNVNGRTASRTRVTVQNGAIKVITPGISVSFR